MNSAETTASASDEPPPPRPRGTALGRYLLLDRLGAGGMGVVYAAYDPELDRKVAVKILHADHAGRPQRLRREAQAMARLSHPNVIAVHDVGIADGAVFVAMDHVDGDNLTKWRASARSWREVVRVFLAAGEGLAAAHRANLVHRDFKPDNVLVRAADQHVFVSDFGLARLLDETAEPAAAAAPSPRKELLTHAGALLGTPAYMAPEQHRGEPADARSDQFAFCVALYEALYDERPFAAPTNATTLSGLDSVGALALEVVKGNVRPAPRDSAVPGWLRKVVLRGLDPASGERWPTMDALLAALRRDPARERRIWLLVGGGVVIVAGVAALLATRDAGVAPTCNGGEARVAAVWDASVKARAEAAFAATGRPYAADTWQRVEHALDDYVGQWSAMREQTCRSTELLHEQSAELEDLRMACLDRQLAAFGALAALFTDHVDAEFLDRAVTTAARLPLLAACADTTALRAEVPLPDDPAARARIADFEQRFAKVVALDAAGKDKEGLAAIELMRAEASDLGYLPAISDVHYHRMGMLSDLRDFKQAELAAQDALSAAADAHQDERMATIMSIREEMLNNRGKFNDGLLLVPVTDALLRRAGNRDAERVTTEHPHAQLLQGAGKLAEAETVARGVVALEDKLSHHKNTYAAVCFTLASILTDEAKYDDAKKYLDIAITTMLAVYGPNNLNLSAAYNTRAVIEVAQHDLPSAERDLQAAFDLGVTIGGPDSELASIAGGNLGAVRAMQGKSADAKAAYDRALAARVKLSGPDHPLAADIYDNLAELALDEHDYPTGLAHAQHAVAIDEKTRGPGHPTLANHLDTEGDLLLAMARPADAEPVFERAIAIDVKALPPDHVQLATARIGAARSWIDLGQPAKAPPLIAAALAALDPKDPDESQRAVARFALGRALWAIGTDKPGARAKVEEARAIYERITKAPADQQELALVTAWLVAHPP